MAAPFAEIHSLLAQLTKATSNLSAPNSDEITKLIDELKDATTREHEAVTKECNQLYQQAMKYHRNSENRRQKNKAQKEEINQLLKTNAKLRGPQEPKPAPWARPRQLRSTTLAMRPKEPAEAADEDENEDDVEMKIDAEDEDEEL